MREFIVNNYITLKLENGYTNVYINGNHFTQFKLYWIKDPSESISFIDETESYDDATERLRKNLDPSKMPEILSRSEKIPPEKEYESHCITLKNWSDSDYNTDLLSTNIAIPLLEKLTKIGDPLAKKIFKEEIAKRFKSGHLSFILYFIKTKYLYYLTEQEEREAIYYNNNERLRGLIDNLSKSDNNSKIQAISILMSLIRLKDQSAKLFLNEQIITAFSSGNLKILDYIDRYYTFKHLSNEEKERVYYENNEHIKDMIDKALKGQDDSINFAFPFLLRLINIQNQNVRELLKENVRKWILTGNKSTVEKILKNPLTYVSRFFTYTDMIDLRNNYHTPKQLVEYIDTYLEEYDKIHDHTRELIISREELLNGSYFPFISEITNSDFFIIFFRSRRTKEPHSIKPIYNNNVKKIIINCHLSDKPIGDKVKELKLKYKLLYEYCFSKVIKSTVGVHVRELYLLDIGLPLNEEIETLFTSLRDDIRVRVEKI